MQLALAAFRILFATVISTDAVQLTARKALCPPCLNGGLCLPDKAAISRTLFRARPVKFRCFCPTPWVGVSCETKGFDAVSPLDEKQSGVPDSSATQDREDRQFLAEKGFMAVAQNSIDRSNSDAFLLSLTLDDHAEALLNDAENLRLAVYSALCPSLPCSLGLVLEDVSLLTLSPNEVRLSISWPSDDTGAALKEELESQLRDENSNLMVEAFKGLVLQFQMEDISIDQSHVSADHSYASSKVQTASQDADGNETASHTLRPRRSDRDVGLHEHDYRSSATYNIIFFGVVFLAVSVAEICCERLGRWLFPQSVGTQQLETTTGDDSDFRAMRGILEVSRFPLNKSVNLSLQMYVVQARARELTRGFGDPPQWAQNCMIAMNVGLMICLLTWIVEAGKKSRLSSSIGDSWKLHVHLFWQPNWLIVSLMQASLCVVNVCAFALLACICTMKVEDCQMDSKIRSILEDQESPSLSQEHQACLVLLVQFWFVTNFENLKLLQYLFRQLTSARQEEADATLKRTFAREMLKFRFLTKTSNFAPILCLLILAVNEVPAVTDEDQTFRYVVMHLSQGALQIYFLSAFVLLILFGDGSSSGTSLLHNGVPISADTDSFTAHDDDVSDSMWAFSMARRVLLLITYISAIVLGMSIFFLSGGDGGPGPAVDWAILWIVFLIAQSIVVYMFLLVQELMADVLHVELLYSAVREIEGLTAIIPMLGVIFLIAYRRGLDVNRNGELPEWVLTAMNAVAQTILLQMVLAVLEANMSRFLVTGTSWESLHTPRSPRALQEGLNQQRPDREGEPPPVAQLPRAGTSVESAAHTFSREGDPRAFSRDSVGPEIDDVMRRQAGYQSSQQPYLSRQRRSELVDVHYEKKYLGCRLLTLASTFGQLALLATLVIACELVIIAIWTLDSESPSRKPHSYGSSLMPLYPVTVPTSMALETMVALITLFFTVKCSSQLITTLRSIYNSISWGILAGFHRADQIVELIPLTILLCFMAQSRAVAFHGLHASPPYFVQAHMVILIAGKTTQIAAMLLSPLLTDEFEISENKGSVIPSVRHFLLIVEQLGFFFMVWGTLVVMLAIIFMRPEHVVLSNGSNGQPWMGEGDEPSLPFTAWVLLGVMMCVYFFSVLNNVCQITIMRWRHTAGRGREREKWNKWLRSAVFVRWLRIHHGAVLARQASIGSIVLALLFVPVSGIRHPVLGAHHNQDVSQTQMTILELSFFVAGILSVVKAVVAFWFGFVPAITPDKQDLIDDKEPEHHKQEGQQPLLDCPVSNDWRLGDEKKSEFFMTQMFRRMGLAVIALECLSIAFLVGSLMVSLEDEHVLKIDESSIWLFYLYWLTNAFWGGAQYLDKSFRRLDGLIGVVSVCPTLILLHMALKHRTVEVAGRQAVEPDWLQNLFYTAAVNIFVEFVIVAITPGLKSQVSVLSSRGVAAPSTPTTSPRSPRRRQIEQTKVEPEQHWSQNIRIGYILLRSGLRLFLNLIIGGIIFGLFWMTREQCST